MSAYKGMRWFKCDFQVQTPEFSVDWLDADLKLGEPRRPVVQGQPNEGDIQEKARTFLRRCHALELEIIGLTDHNFSGKTDARDWFLTHLVEQNKAVAAEVGRDPLYIFPGFEVDIGYHVLCLFNPVSKSSKLIDVSETLTTLGLGLDARFKGGKPSPLRHDNKNVALATLLHKVQVEKGGIVIAAHAFSKDGICNDAMHVDDYKNENLLCVEVSEYPLVGKARDLLEGGNKDWKRGWRQPAFVMSSDAKSIKEGADDKPGPNTLGYRYTWVKMSSPSVEGLRQAFLDPQSRISLPTKERQDRPDKLLTYPRFSSIRVSSLAFLRDQSIHFSPNLNCIIGGRGTGKSTLLECIRIATDRQSDNDDVERKTQRIRRTFSEETEIRIVWQAAPGVVDEIVFNPTGDGEWRWGDKSEEQTRAFLQQIPLQIFSQGELTEIASDEGAQGNRMLPLVDATHSAALHELQSSEAIIRADVMKLYAASDQKVQLGEDIDRLQLELQELDRQWQARKDVQAEAQAHRFAQAAEQYLHELEESLVQDIEAIASSLPPLTADTVPELPALVAGTADAGWYEGVRESVVALKGQLHIELDKLAADLKRRAAAVTSERADWKTLKSELETAQKQFFEVCKEKGLQPQDVSRLQDLDRQRQAKSREIDERRRRFTASANEVRALDKKPEELSQNWQEQFRLRKDSSESLNALTAPSVVASVRYMGDQAHFTRLWNRLAPDRRTKLGRAWEELGEGVFVSHMARHDTVALWDWLRDWVSKGANSPGMEKYDEHRQDLNEHLSGAARAIWRDVRNIGVADYVDLTLYRAGGQRIGSISGGELSEGQRNTAVLTLLLAQGNGPMVIDQPEDEVDSNFLYEHLVPLLRRAKNQRQLIFVTHNANIPVNADGELICALEAVGGRGQIRVEGGLDMELVTGAVLDIMEGTDEAFRRRSEKYHF